MQWAIGIPSSIVEKRYCKHTLVDIGDGDLYKSKNMIGVTNYVND